VLRDDPRALATAGRVDASRHLSVLGFAELLATVFRDDPQVLSPNAVLCDTVLPRDRSARIIQILPFSGHACGPCCRLWYAFVLRRGKNQKESTVQNALLANMDTAVLIVAGVVVVVATQVTMLVLLFTKCYVRCPSNKILVIHGRSGQGSDCQCVHGGAKFIMPVLQKRAWLSLDAIRVEITGPAAEDELAESLFLPNVYNIAIGTEPDLMQHAAKRLLGLSTDEIRTLAADAIADRLAQVLAEQQSRPTDPALVLELLSDTVESNLNELGLTVLNSRRA
jgi:hypothetical protein